MRAPAAGDAVSRQEAGQGPLNCIQRGGATSSLCTICGTQPRCGISRCGGRAAALGLAKLGTLPVASIRRGPAGIWGYQPRPRAVCSCRRRYVTGMPALPHRPEFSGKIDTYRQAHTRKYIMINEWQCWGSLFALGCDAAAAWPRRLRPYWTISTSRSSRAHALYPPSRTLMLLKPAWTSS